MSAITTLSLKNHATTEVDFVPSKIDPQTGVVSYFTTASTYDGRSQATISVSLPRSGTSSSRVKVKGKVAVPIMDLVTGLKIDECIANFEFSMPKNSLLADRRDLRAYITDYLSDNVVIKAIENFESPY